MIAVLRTLSLAAALFASAVPTLAAQRLVIRAERGMPVVTTEVLIAAGLADAPPEQAGIAYLAARSLADPVRPLLDSLGASLTVRTLKDAVSFSVVSAPDAWPEASRALFAALFRDPVDSLAMERQRAEIREELDVREANPGDALRLELDRAFWGEQHPWALPAAGTKTSVGALNWDAVDGFVRTNFLPERTVTAVVGSVDSLRVVANLRPYLAGGSRLVPAVDAPRVAETAVWRRYESITTWIGASYRFPLDADVEAIRAVAALVTEALAPGPARASIYNVDSEILLRAGGGELRFQLVVAPAEAERWGEALQQAVERAGGESTAQFALQSRRIRGRRLGELAAPEARAAELARRLLLGRSPDPTIQAAAVSQQRVRAALRRLERPALVFLGPEEGGA